MKMLIAVLSLFAFLATPTYAAPFSAELILVTKDNVERGYKKKSKWWWCKKRLDKGWVWDKDLKKCMKPENLK